jgi:hypothetical protein
MVRSLPAQLMRAVLLWQSAPHYRTTPWALTLCDLRQQVRWTQKECSVLTDTVVRAVWDDALDHAQRLSTIATNQILPPQTMLHWEDVFEAEYGLPEEFADDSEAEYPTCTKLLCAYVLWAYRVPYPVSQALCSEENRTRIVVAL